MAIQTDRTIMQVLPSLKDGGVERGTIDMAIHMQENGISNLVVSSGGPFVSRLTDAGIKHVTLPVKSKNPFTIRANISRLAKVIYENNVALVHARSRAPAWSAYFAARRTGAHFVTTFHGAYGTKPPFLKKFYNGVMLRGERIIAVSEYMARHIKSTYRNVNPSKITVINRGIDPEVFNPARFSEEEKARVRTEYDVPEGKTVLMLPLRITPIKGLDIIIKALEGVEGVYCMIVGMLNDKEQYMEKLQHLVDHLGLHDTVRFFPPIKDIEKLFAINDIYINATLKGESFGRTIVEAQAMGNIVIVNDRGAAPELVREGETGFVVPAADIAELRKAIGKAMALAAEDRERMAKAAREFVIREASLKNMCEKTLRVYEEVLSS